MPTCGLHNRTYLRAVAALRGVTAPINVLQFSEATRMRAGLGAAPGKRMMPPFLVVAANEFRRARLSAGTEMPEQPTRRIRSTRFAGCACSWMLSYTGCCDVLQCHAFVECTLRAG